MENIQTYLSEGFAFLQQHGLVGALISLIVMWLWVRHEAKKRSEKQPLFDNSSRLAIGQRVIYIDNKSGHGQPLGTSITVDHVTQENTDPNSVKYTSKETNHWFFRSDVIVFSDFPHFVSTISTTGKPVEAAMLGLGVWAWLSRRLRWSSPYTMLVGGAGTTGVAGGAMNNPGTLPAMVNGGLLAVGISLCLSGLIAMFVRTANNGWETYS